MHLPNPDTFVAEQAKKEANESRRWELLGQALDAILTELRVIREQLQRVESAIAGNESGQNGQSLEH
jgi:hypothetical protein